MFAIDWLGVVVLRGSDLAIPLSIRKTLALLVLLAREGPMPRERVAALLWPALDERTARRNLRRELARLREAGAGAVVQADGDHLAVAVGVEVTAHRFEATLQAGRPDEALACWRGPPADGLHLDDAPPWEEWMAQERRRLEALRAEALATSAAQHEAAGAWALALERIRTLLAADPLQEQHHRTAMRLLERLGQREAALAQYEHCTRLLADELGLQPMAATRELAAALRAPDPLAAPAPTAARATPADLLPERLPFVGREREVAWLEQAWRSGRPLLIEGEGGVGKTRLVTDFAAAQGPYALVPCRSGDAELPLSSFTRALRALAGPDPAVQALPGWVGGELARLMPELGPAPEPLRSEGERLRFGQACALAWAHWADGNFDAILIDDWHLADADSQALWLQVQDLVPTALRLVLVFRPALSSVAADRVRREAQGGAGHLRLEPLPPEAVYELVQRLSGAPEPRRFAATLARATEGNPFYMVETLRHLVERGLLGAAADGRWHTPFDDRADGYAELPLPDSVRGAVLGRVARLPERVRRVLEAAALADEPLAAELLAPACALSEVEATLALEEALQARLLRELDEGGLAFVHHLVQQALEASLDAARRRSVHRRLALGAAAAGAPAARIAAHHEAGGEPRRAVRWRQRAGDEAMRLHALDQAVQHWRQALADGATPAQALEIGTSLMGALNQRHLADEAEAQAEALLRLTEQGAGTAAQCMEVRIEVARQLSSRGRGERALALIDALPPAPDRRLQALALKVRSWALLELDRPEEAAEHARQALDLGGLDAEVRGGLLAALGMALAYRGRLQQALQVFDEWLALARGVGDRIGEARALARRGAMLLNIGDLVACEATLREAVARCESLGLIAEQRNLLFNLCVLHSAQSRPGEVLRTAQTCWGLWPPMAQDVLRVMVRLAFVEAHLALGDLGAAHPWALGAIDDAAAVGQVFGAASVVLTCAELLALLGESAALAPLRAPLRALLDAAGMGVVRAGTSETWLVLAECELMAGRPAEAQVYRDALGDEPLEGERVGVRAAIVDAALRLAAGDAPAALVALPADGTPGLNEELRWRALGVRLRAEAARGGCDAATLAAADAALAQDGVHALAALLLHQALRQVADTPLRRQAWHRRIGALAQTLHAQPELQARFERRWRGS